MALPTSRTQDAARVTINDEICTGCGLCVSVCKDYGLLVENGKARLADSPIFGCVGCGHCMAVCPNGAIEVRGRALEPEHIFPAPSRNAIASYDQLFTLLQRRRSIREFLDAPVESHVVEKILDAAKTAPIGLPPSDVHVMVLENREKNRAFTLNFCTYLKGMRWLVSPWFLTLMRPFWGKANDTLFRNFVKPALTAFTVKMNAGVRNC